jgi:hypothetical protein
VVLHRLQLAPLREALHNLRLLLAAQEAPHWGQDGRLILAAQLLIALMQPHQVLYDANASSSNQAGRFSLAILQPLHQILEPAELKDFYAYQ